MEGKAPAPERLEAALASEVHLSGRYRPFGELSVDEVRRMAESVGAAGSWGLLQRAAKVARAWGELARLMDERGAATVGELDGATVVTFAERTWVLPPAEGLL